MAQGTIKIYWHIIKFLSSLSFIQAGYYVSSIFLVGHGFCTSNFKRDKDGHCRQWAVPEENQSGRHEDGNEAINQYIIYSSHLFPISEVFFTMPASGTETFLSAPSKCFSSAFSQLF